MDLCLFCTCELNPGSSEHVFLSALGGRLTTSKAICLTCNNAFAGDETGKVDDSLAKSFEEVRNLLKVWSGRDAPPPTLFRAGSFENGVEFDLAPGYTPIARPGLVPKQLGTGSELKLTASDSADVKRMLRILSKRGMSTTIKDAVRVERKAPPVNRSLSFDGPKIWRSVAKTAVTSFVVFYGNEKARKYISRDLRDAIRKREPDITNFAGWDFINEWPTIAAFQPHSKTPKAERSGFEHSVLITDVGANAVAYILLFGHWSFSVRLGPASRLPIRGLALNPRSLVPTRFIISATPPENYLARCTTTFRAEHLTNMKGAEGAFASVLKMWSDESSAAYLEKLTDELGQALVAAGGAEAERETAVMMFATKLASIEHGSAWTTQLDPVLDADE